MIFLQYGGESRLNFIENLCEMVVSSLMYMIKFCEGFVADIFFLIIFMLLWMSRYLHKSENKTWIPKNKLSVLTLITLNNIRKGNGRLVGKICSNHRWLARYYLELSISSLVSWKATIYVQRMYM